MAWQFPIPAAADDCIDYGKYVRWVGGTSVADNANSVASNGHFAYMSHGIKPGEENGLQIIDVVNPEAPHVVGGLETYAPASDVAIAGSYAYLTTYLDSKGALEVIDVSQPGAPVIVSSITTPLGARSVVVSGDHAYVTTADVEDGSLLIVDISDPAAAFTVGSQELSASTGITVSGGYAYVATFWEGVQVVDVSDPTAPAVVGSAPLDLGCYDIVLVGDYAYVTNRFAGGVSVLDVSDPTDPYLILTLESEGCPFGIDAAGDYVYFASNSDGLRILDVSTPSAPTVVGSYLLDVTFDVAVHGDYAYVAGGYMAGFGIFDISHPGVPAGIGSTPTTDLALDVAAEGDLACIADRHAGLQIADVSDRWAPKIIGSVDVPHRATFVAMAGRFAYVIDFTAGLLIVDISSPSSPLIAATFPTPGLAKAVTVVGELAYIADWYDLCVVDISNPSAPKMIGALMSLDHVYDIEVAGDYAYLAVMGGGLQVVDISDPTDPRLLATLDIPGFTYGVALNGSYAYVADWSAGLHVVDVSTPTAPIHVTSLKTTYRARDAEVVDDLAYVIYTHGVQIVDISIPANPRIVGQMPVEVYGAAVAGDYMYMAHGIDGFVVGCAQCVPTAGLPPTDPGMMRLTLQPPRPNPVTGETILEFSAQAAGDVRLLLCDPGGRCVRRILAGAISAGPHRVRWDGLNDSGAPVATGTYFVRLDGEGEVHAVRLLRVR
jgi:hypothetical protein